MATLILAHGIPASGKTTAAKAWVDEAPEFRRMINRDRLRYALFGVYSGLSGTEEGLVTQVQTVQVGYLLGLGLDVFVDDTNLNDRSLTRLAMVAEDSGAEHQIRNFVINVDDAIRRDYRRGLRGEPWVGEDVIRSMAARSQAPRIPGQRGVQTRV